MEKSNVLDIQALCDLTPVFTPPHTQLNTALMNHGTLHDPSHGHVPPRYSYNLKRLLLVMNHSSPSELMDIVLLLQPFVSTFPWCFTENSVRELTMGDHG